jgi:hypothetical protein
MKSKAGKKRSTRQSLSVSGFLSKAFHSTGTYEKLIEQEDVVKQVLDYLSTERGRLLNEIQQKYPGGERPLAP